MKKTVIIGAILASTLLFTGCGSTAIYVKQADGRVTHQELDPSKKADFDKSFHQVALKTKTDTNYKRMSLKQEDKQWFKTTTYMVWNRDITLSEYVQKGVSRYPGHEYEFNFIARNI